MDSFELNKIIGAILGTLLFIMGVGFLAEAIYHPIEGRGPGYTLPEPEVAEAGGVVEEAAPVTPLPVLLASASVSDGQAAARKCQSCHNFEQGAGNKQGPELYDTVGKTIATHADFAYSDILLSYQAEGQVWTYDNLDHFIAAPREFAPGTKMAFAGVRDPVERANILAYLASLSASPVPFPVVEDVPAEASAADDNIMTDPADAPATMTDTLEVEGTEPVPTDADSILTPTETQDETPVVGTPATEAPALAPQ